LARQRPTARSGGTDRPRTRRLCRAAAMSHASITGRKRSDWA
jgi:hypothetical protein